MRHMIQSIIAGLLALASLVVTPLTAPETVFADDATVSACTQAGFDAALANVQSSGGGTITFNCGGPATIGFTSEKTITSGNTVIIEGSTGDLITFDGGGTTRLFRVESGATLEVRSLALRNGSAAEGGAIHVAAGGTLRVFDAWFDGNQADFGVGLRGGGAIISEGGVVEVTDSLFTNNVARAGGAISSFSSGPLTVTGSTFAGNSAGFGGAIANFGGDVTLINSTLSGNTAQSGGAIDNRGAVTLIDSTLSANTAFSCGAIENVGAVTLIDSTLSGNTAASDSPLSGDTGGAICNYWILTLTNSTLSANTAEGNGGGIWNRDLGVVTLTNSTLSGNTASEGGGIFNDEGDVTLTNSTLSGNTAIDGGAIYNWIGHDGHGDDEASVTLTNSTLSSNTADEFGGAIYNDDGGDVTLTNSTLSGNTAGEDGGGILNVGPLTLTNSTLSGNTAGDAGGGIFNGFLATLTNSTLSANMAGDRGGGIFNGFATTTLQNTIIANSGAPSGPGGNCDGIEPVTSQGGNLSDDASCALGAQGDLDDTDDGLGPLDDNGGPTQTHRPQSGSDAIDNALVGFCPAADQRGVSRPQGAGCDIGAVEVGPVPVEIFSLNGHTSDEGSPVAFAISISGPQGVSFTFEVDCDNNDSYATPGTADGAVVSAPCMFDDGIHTIGVRACDAADANNCDTDTTEVTVTNVAPSVAQPQVDPSSSNEGQSVSASATFSDPGGAPSGPDNHTCMVDWGDGTPVEAGALDQQALTCTGTHTYADDGDYTITVTVTDDDDGQDSNTTLQTVDNLPPTINQITTNAPVPHGQPVTITVQASDPGVNDTLTYSFDCDDDGVYETPGNGSTGSCPFDPAQAASTLGVEVTDDDLGVATGTVEVKQTIALCGNSWNGTLYLPTGANCPTGTLTLTLPAAYPTTLCYATGGQLVWKPGGNCGANWTAHIVPLDGPLTFCASIWTGQLSHSWSGACGTYETPGVIPG